jgi:tetratricopeptide (TPR) repeat protein/DNA-binding beta-propeller fold protein YncE
MLSTNAFARLAGAVTLCLSVVANAADEIRLTQSFRGSEPAAPFSYVAAVAAGPDGTVLLLDNRDNTLLRLGAEPSRRQMAEGGLFAGSRVQGITALDDGRLALAIGGEVRFLGPDGNVLGRIGDSGQAEGHLGTPAAVAWSINRRLYVADRQYNRIAVFGPDGVFVEQFTGTKAMPLDTPEQLAVDRRERVYVFGRTKSGTVTIFGTDRQPMAQLVGTELRKQLGVPAVKLTAMTVDPATGLLILGDSEQGRIYAYDWERQRLITRFGTKGTQRGQFSDIAGLALLPDGRLAVADNGGKKVELFTLPPADLPPLERTYLANIHLAGSHDANCAVAYREGEALWCFGQGQGARLGSDGRPTLTLRDLKDPIAAAFGHERIAVIDGDRLKLFDGNGTLVFDSGANRTAPRNSLDFSNDRFDSDTEGKFDTPVDLFARHDRIYVVDRRNRRVQIFSPQGLYLDKLAPADGDKGYFEAPVAVAVDSAGRLFVADRDRRRVLAFDADKRFLYSLDAGFTDLIDLAVDADDQIYVLGATDNNRARLAVFRDTTLRFMFAARAADPTALSGPVSLSVSREGPTTVSIYDRDRKRLLDFAWQQVPPMVEGLEVAGGTGAVRLSWQPIDRAYVRGYQVFAAPAVQGPWQRLGEAASGEFVVEKPAAEADFYRVTAVNDFAQAGPPSPPVQDRFREGYAHFSAARFNAATDVFAALHEDDPRNADAVRFLGLSLMEQGQWDAARRYFERLAELPGQEVAGLELQVDALEKAGEPIEARKVVARLLATGQAPQSAFRRCGELSLALDDAIDAVQCLEKALARKPDDARALLLLGRAYIALDVIDQGRSFLTRAREAAPQDLDIIVVSAQVEEGLGDDARAVKLYDQALALAPDNQAVRLALARALLRTGAQERVRNLAMELTRHEVTAGDGHYLLGITALTAERHGEALIALTKATRAAPDHVGAWLALAETYEKMGKQDRMREPLVQAAGIDEQSFEASLRLGRFDFQQGDAARAVPMLARAAQLNPKHYEAQLLLAEAYVSTAQLMEAAEAARAAQRLDEKRTEPLVLLADISARQGKNGAAIGYLKQALERDKTSYALQLRLGSLYLENNLFEAARTALEQAILLDGARAEPHALLGQVHLKRRAYDEAISAFETALSLAPSEANRLLLDTAYAERKRSLEFASNAPPVVLKDLELYPVFSATYKQYADTAVGSVRVENAGDVDLGNLKLTFTIKGYMDFPTQLEIPLLKADSSEVFPLRAAFNNRVLDVDEDTGVQVEVALGYTRDGQADSITLTQPMTLYGKNAILWSRPQMVGAFVTPKDDTLRDFVRSAVNALRPDPGPLNGRVVTAMTLFSALSAHGVRYVTDPNAPYSKLAQDQVDYVQFARETLKFKSGDCDDLTVLFSAALENLGIETVVLDVPGHLLLMFDTGLTPDQADTVSTDPELLAIHDGRVWIPLETTMIATSFGEAWTEGARKYREHLTAGKLTMIPVHEAWNKYLPVTLKPAGYDLPLPATENVAPLLRHDRAVLLERSLERLVTPYRAMLSVDPDNRAARMQMAIIYARNGLHEKAFAMLDALAGESEDAAVHNNRGNVHLLRGEINRALKSYLRAEQFDGADAHIKLNVAMAHYRASNMDEARRTFSEAVSMDGTIATEHAGFAKLLGL